MSLKKLFIQIPCFNEESSVGEVISSIPRKELEKLGLEIKTLVIDDCSSDETIQNAKEAGVDFIISHKKQLGLARSFKDGIEFCLKNKADIIVNTDGDNQYNQSEIVDLVKPIIEDKADLVIGDRQVEKLKTMPASKKLGNVLGSWLIRNLTGEDVKDASSGFRAIDSNLARSFNLLSAHTYTHETIIQAANLGAKVVNVPIEFKKRAHGQSKLISQGVFMHIKKSIATIIRTILLYKAFKYLLGFGGLMILIGLIIGLRFIYFFADGQGNGHIQSLILSSTLINLGFMIILLGFIADLISVNRKLIEDLKSKQE